MKTSANAVQRSSNASIEDVLLILLRILMFSIADSG